MSQVKNFVFAPDDYDVYMRQHLAELDRKAEIDTAEERGITKERERNVLGLLKNKAPISLIVASIGISEEAVRKIGLKAGLAL